MENKENTYPEGHFLGIWMGIGIAISFVIVFLCIVTDNPGFIGIGPAIGKKTNIKKKVRFALLQNLK